MSTIYTPAPDEVKQMAERVMRNFHPQFIEVELKVDLIFALAAIDEETGVTSGCAIKHGGYPANAICKILSLKDRVMGRGDAEIVIDGDQWNDWSPEQQEALLDHELHHIIICKNQAGAIKRDDYERPKLKMRKHDAQFGWFKAIAERHGSASFECQQAKQLFEQSKVYFQPELLPASQTADASEHAARAVRGNVTRLTIDAEGMKRLSGIAERSLAGGAA